MPQCIRLRRSAWYAVWHQYLLVDAAWYSTRARLVVEQGYCPKRTNEQLPFEPMRGREIIERLDELKGYTLR